MDYGLGERGGVGVGSEDTVRKSVTTTNSVNG